MNTPITRVDDGIAIFHLRPNDLRGSRFGALNRLVQQETERAASAILLDCTELKELGFGCIALIVELVARHPKIAMHICNLSERAQEKLLHSGMDRALDVHRTVATALADSKLQQHRLTTTRALVFGSETGFGPAALPATAPAALTDILGRPLISRRLDQLAQFGLTDVVLAPGASGRNVRSLVKENLRGRRQPFFYRVENGETLCPAPQIIAELQTLHQALEDDVLLASGIELDTCNLADFMQFHRKSGADLTELRLINQTATLHEMRSPPVSSRSRQFNEHHIARQPVLFAVKAALLADFAPGLQTDLQTALRQHIQKVGGRSASFKCAGHIWDLNTPKSYVALLNCALRNEIPSVSPFGEEIAQNIWRSPESQLSRGISFGDYAYFAKDSDTGMGTKLMGTNVIGRGAKVAAFSRLENTIVEPNAQLRRKLWSDGKILHPDWVIDHEMQRDWTPQNLLRDFTPEIPATNLLSRLRA